ncbi:lariat debranching enzyme [Paramarasmius palmivorus]|uniref:Lariat debranching enzyme n=1 Tax=Paramarasmius palmivorus TaxID=297713 RepID=A0AAW0B8A5_9AGAR
MKVAIEGCCHGELDNIYAHIADLEAKNHYKVDLLLICGDFQAIRNHQDLQCMAVPDKYKEIQTFFKYYTGAKRAPIPTIVIGGNHEASNYLWELYHGGWLAPNIYYLGHAGCVQFNGLRIAGASGIFKGYNFSKGFFEKLPYDKEAIRSAYHIREFNVRKLSLLSSPNIFLSHDWPVGIDQYGDYNALIKVKSHFRQEIKEGRLGSPPLMGLLRALKPEWWFSAHLHCRFEATVVHDNGGIVQPISSQGAPSMVSAKNPDEIAIEDDFDGEDAKQDPAPLPVQSNNPDEINLDDEIEDVAAPPAPAPAPPPPSITRFLALDKCLPKRKFLEVIDIPIEDTFKGPPNELVFDPEWLAVTRAFQPFFSVHRHQIPFPEEDLAREMVAKELEWVHANILKEEMMIPVNRVQQFVQTAPGPGSEGNQKFRQRESFEITLLFVQLSIFLTMEAPLYPNPQTEAYCKLLQIENKIN